MSQLSDIIQINAASNDAAVVLDNGLADAQLVQSFSPTRATIKVLKHICKAILPQATQEERAISLFGNYGSGKSHLAVLIAQLLRNGSGGNAFEGLFQRLNNFDEKKLADELKNTFLRKDDPDAKPYLLVSLYGSEAPSLADQLMEALYDALDRHPDLNPQTILPMTEYEAGVKRFEEIVEKSPEYAEANLSQWQLGDEYLRTDEILTDLKNHQPIALNVFKHWHKEVCHGANFNPAAEGGKNFLDAYREAGKNLAEKEGFSGIVVLWDEFGYALEALLGNSSREPVAEIMMLQNFVETVCKPAQGHSIFIALTHVSFSEYAARMDAIPAIKNRLDTISGRFYRPFKIELSTSESEGYHLLGMQKSWTEQGEQFQKDTQEMQQNLIAINKNQCLFSGLGKFFPSLLYDCYPLHPMMAAGLFALSTYAQSNRTALTFFRDNIEGFLTRTIDPEQSFKAELIRLPELVDYYADSLKEKATKEWDEYQHALKQIPTTLESEAIKSKQAILKLLLLSQLLSEDFQSSESFLAAALYDASINTKDTQYLTTDLTWLSAANVIWKNDVTEQWTLAKDSGVDVEALIAEKLNHFSGRSIETLFNNYPEIQADLLPFLGVHNLDPSDCGIVRSYDVSLLTPPFNKSQLETKTAILSARVFLVLGKEAADIKIAQEKIADISATALYFWLPLAGVRGETITQNGKTFKLGGLLCRYLALDLLLKEKTATENLRRQLQAKWEKSRDDCLDILQRLFGRKGLENGKTKIFKSGQLDALCCKSWHDLRRQLTDNIQQFYSKEIPIYAMNLNGLNDELYTGKSKTLKIVERLLAFKSNPTYQTDLLGENDTSELAALIDGVLGANQLFIESAEGWKIKNKGEAVGAIQTVLKIIHDALLHKRNTPYLVSELRTKLMAPPYGLPSCTLAILAAVAIRDEVPRLRWGNCSKELDFAKNLNSAFTKNSQLTIRLFDFTPEQLAVLFAIGLHFKIPKKDKSNEGYIVECCHKLRSFIKNQPESVKNSSNLLGKSRQLVNFFKQVGTNSKDLATCLVELLNAQTDVDKALVELKVLLEAFEKIANMKAYEVKTTWKDIIPTTIDNKQILISNLTHENASSDAKEIGNLLSKHEEDTKIDANKLTEIVLNKPIDQCSDSEIGQYKGKIETLIEYHQQLPQEIIAHKSDPITTEDDFIHQIEQICNRTTLSDEIMRSTLKTILSKHSDK